MAAGPDMTVGGVLARGFAAIGAAPLRFFGISFLFSALPYLLMELVAGVDFAAVTAAPDIVPVLLAGAGFAAAWLLLYAFAEAMLIRLTVAISEERASSVADLVAVGLRHALPMAGVSILFWLGVWVGSILLIVPGLMLATAWAVAAPALIEERTGVFSAFGRSATLTKGARWRIFGLAVLILTIYMVAAGLLGVADVAVNGVAASARDDTSPVTAILSAALQTIFVAVWTAIQAALYVDLREWKDGPAHGQLAEIFA